MTYTSPLPAQQTPDFRGSALDLVDLTMAYGDIDVLRGVSISVAPGTTTCVIGPSGSGKSTMLRGVNRLHEPKSGDVRLDGESILGTKPDVLRRRIGLVFQHFNLFPDHTALQNVMLALRSVKRMPKAEAKRIAEERLIEVGLGERMDHRPRDLSGGQQQRVAIARALMQQPKVLLADEPIASLDPMNAKIVMDALRDINEREGITVITNLHTLDTARAYCQRIIGMAGGRVVFDGTPAELTTEAVNRIYGSDGAIDETMTSTSINPVLAHKPAAVGALMPAVN